MTMICWIDGSKCYAEKGSVSLSHCGLCQKARLTKRAIQKADSVVVEVTAPED
jgi:hypothetical protein